VIELTLAARHHLTGVESPPLSIEEFEQRQRSLRSQRCYPVVLYLFGRRDGPFTMFAP